MRFLLAAALLASAASPALAAPIRSYADLALAPRGDRIASIDAAARGMASSPCAPPMVRCCGRSIRARACSYSGVTFAPDGALALLARDAKAGTVTLGGR